MDCILQSSVLLGLSLVKNRCYFIMLIDFVKIYGDAPAQCTWDFPKICGHEDSR